MSSRPDGGGRDAAVPTLVHFRSNAGRLHKIAAIKRVKPSVPSPLSLLPLFRLYTVVCKIIRFMAVALT